jgi:hypothetical protein
MWVISLPRPRRRQVTGSNDQRTRPLGNRPHDADVEDNVKRSWD